METREQRFRGERRRGTDDEDGNDGRDARGQMTRRETMREKRRDEREGQQEVRAERQRGKGDK